jgi:hypothetical protein
VTFDVGSAGFFQYVLYTSFYKYRADLREMHRKQDILANNKLTTVPVQVAKFTSSALQSATHITNAPGAFVLTANIPLMSSSDRCEEISTVVDYKLHHRTGRRILAIIGCVVTSDPRQAHHGKELTCDLL